MRSPSCFGVMGFARFYSRFSPYWKELVKVLCHGDFPLLILELVANVQWSKTGIYHVLVLSKDEGDCLCIWVILQAIDCKTWNWDWLKSTRVEDKSQWHGSSLLLEGYKLCWDKVLRNLVVYRLTVTDTKTSLKYCFLACHLSLLLELF